METSVNLVSQLQSDYLAYSMAVLVGRAIPSLYDGLKPAQRRVLTAMKWLGLKPDGKYMKSARVEGETMGKLHPHGGAYGVMVTMAAPWNNNLPLIEGQGNWGSSVDGAAASRYTECKLSSFAWDCLLSDSDTWQLADNYDGSLKEPTELNVKVPTVLLNGQDGIGVGFATKIPPNSLRDICESLNKGTPLVPSFPTGCDIVNDEGLESYLKTGVGSLRLRARLEKSTTGTGKRTRPILTFTNIPTGSNPEKIGQQIKDNLDKNNIVGVTEVRDESDLSGDRLTIVLRAGTNEDVAIRQLYHYTDLDTKFSARLLVIDGTKPVELSPSQLLDKWKTWRLERLSVKFRQEREVCEERREIVLGYMKAIDKIDLVIKIIRSSKTPKEALVELVSNRSLKFTSDQARAILEMKLRTLTNLDTTQLESEEKDLENRLEELGRLIEDEKARKTYMLKEIRNIGVNHGETRRSEIIGAPDGWTAEKTTKQAPLIAKPRFLKIDTKKGLVEQVKGPRGATILERSDKLITLTQDGTLKKLPSSYKGTLGEGYSAVLLAKKETEVKERTYLAVFSLNGQLKAMSLAGADLAKTTSSGKQILPAEATMLYFGEDPYTVTWASSRKKPTVLTTVSTKPGKPGGKGAKIANLTEVKL